MLEFCVGKQIVIIGMYPILENAIYIKYEIIIGGEKEVNKI